MFRSETYYRRAAGEGATYIGLLLVVYDTIAGDLRRAGLAADRGDIAGRCEATNHALLLLGHLESWAESVEDVTLRTSLGQFYGYLRAQAVAFQASTSGDGFAELARLVEETRAVWQQKEMMQVRQAPQVGLGDVVGAAEEGEGRRRMNWSA